MSGGRKKNIVELTRISRDDYRRCGKMPVSIMLDSVRSLLNVGALLRTSDAFLVKEMIMGGITGTPPHPEISKSALGAEDSVVWRKAGDALAEALAQQSRGVKVCVLEQTHGSVSLESFEPERDKEYLLVVGNEVNGVDQRIVDMADVALEIPQSGVKHSLNVSVSGAIALWHFYSRFLKK